MVALLMNHKLIGPSENSTQRAFTIEDGVITSLDINLVDWKLHCENPELLISEIEDYGLNGNWSDCWSDEEVGDLRLELALAECKEFYEYCLSERDVYKRQPLRVVIPLSVIKDFSKPLVANLTKLGINNLQALLLHLPLRYIDETHITTVRDLRLGEAAQVEGEIVHAEVTYKPRKALIARLEDASGQLTLRFLHFYPSQISALKVGTQLRVYGEVRNGFFGYEMVHPSCRAVSEKTSVAETLTPVYSTVAGLTQGSLRKAIGIALAPVSYTHLDVYKRQVH